MPIIPTFVAIPALKPEWRETTLVFRFESGAVLAVDGWRYGTLVVHPVLPTEPRGAALMCVTHAPTRLAILRIDSPEEAMTAAEWLWEVCPKAWTRPDYEVDRASIPAAVEQKCRQVNVLRKFTR